MNQSNPTLKKYRGWTFFFFFFYFFIKRIISCFFRLFQIQQCLVSWTLHVVQYALKSNSINDSIDQIRMTNTVNYRAIDIFIMTLGGNSCIALSDAEHTQYTDRLGSLNAINWWVFFKWFRALFRCVLLRERTQLQDAAKEVMWRCGQRSVVPLSRYQITRRPFSINTQTQTQRQTHARTQRGGDRKDDGPKEEDQEEE